MNTKTLTTEQLADRWMDRREIQNLMGKYVYAVLLKEEKTLVDTYWADLPDISLGVNNGYYVGPEAVRGYYDAVDENTKIRAAYMKNKVLPQTLSNKTEEELHGIGSLCVDGLSTAVIEQAEDGKTIKALWHVTGCDTDIHPEGPYSYWAYGYIAADFILVDDEWKIWHLQDIHDLSAPVGTNFTKPTTVEPMAEFAELATLLKPLPKPTVETTIHEAYHPGRGFQPMARVPEPYVTFADTFSYGA